MRMINPRSGHGTLTIVDAVMIIAAMAAYYGTIAALIVGAITFAWKWLRRKNG